MTNAGYLSFYIICIILLIVQNYVEGDEIVVQEHALGKISPSQRCLKVSGKGTSYRCIDGKPMSIVYKDLYCEKEESRKEAPSYYSCWNDDEYHVKLDLYDLDDQCRASSHIGRMYYTKTPNICHKNMKYSIIDDTITVTTFYRKGCDGPHKDTTTVHVGECAPLKDFTTYIITSKYNSEKKMETIKKGKAYKGSKIFQIIMLMVLLFMALGAYFIKKRYDKSKPLPI